MEKVKFIFVDTSSQKRVKVPLNAVAMVLQPGDIILSGNRIMPLTLLIRLFTWSRYSHGEIAIGDKKTAGAHFKGIIEQEFVKQVNWFKYFIILRPKGASNHERDKVVNIAKNLVGSRYDFIHLFQYAWRAILGTLGRAPIADDPKRYVCLEFVAYCWHQVGIKVGGTHPDNATGRSIVREPNVENVMDKLCAF